MMITLSTCVVQLYFCFGSIIFDSVMEESSFKVNTIIQYNTIQYYGLNKKTIYRYSRYP